MAGRILIADSTATNRIILKVKLAAARYQALQAADGRSALALARSQRPDLLIYVSCNPSTLARDLKRLGIGENYTLSRLGCFDMFPQTAHLESVAVLTRIGGPPDRTWKPPA